MTDRESNRPVRSSLQQVIYSRSAIRDDARPEAAAQSPKAGRVIAQLVKPFQDQKRERGEISLAQKQRRLAAIVAADVVGQSHLMGRDESGRLAALKAVRRDVVDPSFAADSGRIVKSTGDGRLLEFASVFAAGHRIFEVQTAMAGRTADGSEDFRMAWRSDCYEQARHSSRLP